MTVTWSQLGSTSIQAGNDFTITTTTEKGTGLSSGYLIRVNVVAEYSLPESEGGGTLPVVIGGSTAIVHMTGTAPTNWAWAQEDQSGDNPQFTTYIGTPLDGSGNPIGTVRVYRQDMRFNDDGPGAGNHISLTRMG